MKHSILTLSALTAVATAGIADLHRRGALCGVKGYDKDTEGYYYGTQGTYSGCSARCRHDSRKCKSFSYGNGECNLYMVTVSGNLVPVHDSPYTFYDISCVSAASTSSTSSKVSTTSITTLTASATNQMGTTSSKSSTTAIPTTSQLTTTRTTTATVMTTTTVSRNTKSTINTTSSKPSITTSTSTSATTTTTTTTTTAVTSSTMTPPCPLPTFTVTNFKYINSTHNCDCAGSGPDVGDGTGCLDPNGNWCDPRYDQDCTHCGIGVCMTGLGVQPVGYGPPDSISADISNIGSCFQENPGTTPLRTVGDGQVVRCGGSEVQWVFSGDSTKAKSTAFFTLQNQIYCENGGYYQAYGSGNTSMSCSYDSQKNATCVLDSPFLDAPATSFSYAYYADNSNSGSSGK